MSAQAAADLNAAADLLERDGWTQGDYHRVIDGRLCHCAGGAIAVVTGSHTDLHPHSHWHWQVDYKISRDGDQRRLDALEALRVHVGGLHVPDWNDARRRTKDEVVAALRAAAGTCTQ